MRSDRAERVEPLTGVVFDVKRYALHDGPGIRTTVFLKGCPLRCGWCQNPESWVETPEVSFRAGRCVGCGRCVEACERGAIALSDGRASTDAARCELCGDCVETCRTGAREVVGRRVTVDEIVSEVERDAIFYDESGGGVTFSGGEPLAQAEFLTAALAGCRARGVHTAVDTSCSAPWAVVEAVAAHTDLFLCDIKHMDDAEHERLTGVGNALIMENIRRLVGLPRGRPSDRAGKALAAAAAVLIRMPVLPGVNDDEANLAAVAEFVSGLGIERVDLLPYNEGGPAKLGRLLFGSQGGPELLALARPDAERMKEIAAKLGESGLAVGIGG